MKALHIPFLGQNLFLHPFKSIYWEEKKTLIIADLHLGKVTHFRKAGIPVPLQAADTNWDKLYTLFLEYQPKRLLVLGDLFHSSYNSAWEEWAQFVQQFPSTRFELVLGNHDILELKNYQEAGLIVHSIALREPPFLFTHEPSSDNSLYNLAGHIHPCVLLKGAAKQYLRLACFYFGATAGILPAFGAFTGMAKLDIKKGEHVYVITENEVLNVSV